jgi:hypothetical protein
MRVHSNPSRASGILNWSKTAHTRSKRPELVAEARAGEEDAAAAVEISRETGCGTVEFMQ